VDASPAGKWGVATGQVWALGAHRLAVGDCTDAALVSAVLAGESPDVMVADPPYSSGGFQEAGRAAGSIGTNARAKPRIVNDGLSTRGYTALMRQCLQLSMCSVCYIFTDWRMWVTLFDIVESCGFGVRNMLVWDKVKPGMGVGWRSQHELIMFASRVWHKFDKHRLAVGNVLRARRTGNRLHPTQKPLEIIEAVLALTNWAETVYDPFAGSGTTVIAAERLGRRCYAIEIDPGYAAVCLQRWRTLTDQEPLLI
jgi:DNA modification methylase